MAGKVYTISLTDLLPNEDDLKLLDADTACSALMTTGARRGKRGNRRRGSYTVHGHAKRYPCPNRATQLIDGKPYCDQHGPSKFRIDPYYDSKEWRNLRQQVLERDEYVCQYCGGIAHQADHVIPRGRGGPDAMHNLVACCRDCNKIAAGNEFKSFKAKKRWVLAARKPIEKKVDRRPSELLEVVQNVDS